MAPQADDENEVERLREAVRLFNLAVESCEKVVSEAEDRIKRSGQDSDPE
jgi:hypothetical protein